MRSKSSSTSRGDRAAPGDAPERGPGDAPVRYTVRVADAAAHRFEVELVIDRPAALQRVSLPVWIPGSYLIREFQRHLQALSARQGRAARRVEQIDKATWEIACEPGRPLALRYAVHAFDASVRAAWLDARRGFFNGPCLLLRVHGQEGGPHALAVPPPAAHPDWQLATAMPPARVDGRGFGAYRARDYDELADHPVELGAFWSGRFRAGGAAHRFVVAGAPASFDGPRLLRDAQKICEAAIAFWHGGGPPPMRRYVFMLNVAGEGYGGLEHRESAALICGLRDLPRRGAAASAAAVGEGYVTLLGLISHEYFHAWNVKRLKPAEFARYDYGRENYTRLLWFFEGFTSYYDDLLLRRAGLIDDEAYFKRLTKTVNQVLQTPGRRAQSLAQASFDAWVRYYRPDENTPNSTVSYYAKGALVALCLDLTLRREGRATLDDVMRGLWRRCGGANNGAMTEADLAAVLAELGGRGFERELAAWVHGTGDLPLKTLLPTQGARLRREPAQWAQALGLRVSEDRGGIVIKTVLGGGPAAQAGMAAGDEWLGLEVSPRPRRASPNASAAAGQAEGWRLAQLDDLPLYAGAARAVTAIVARGPRLLRLPLALPRKVTTWRLLPRESAADPSWPGC